MEVLETISTLEDMQEWERDNMIALMEYLNTEDVQQAIDKQDEYIFYSDLDSYYDSCDESLDFTGCSEILERYFDYDSFHSDCEYDIFQASNGVCILK